MARSTPTSPRRDKWIDETSCDIRQGLVDNCTHSRLILIFMEYYLMSDGNAYAECDCPMLRCRETFPNAREMLTHLKNECGRLDEGEFKCPVPDCREVIRYPREKKECSWTHSKTSNPGRFSRLTHCFSQSSGKSKSSQQPAMSLRRGSPVSWIRKGQSPGDLSPFSPNEVGQEDPSANQHNKTVWDAHAWEHQDGKTSSQPHHSRLSHQTAEIGSDLPVWELSQHDRVSNRTQSRLHSSGQPPQYVDSSTNTPESDPKHPSMQHGGPWGSDHPTVASVSPQNTVYHDGHQSVGMVDAYQASLPSTAMSRNSTRRSPVSEMAGDDHQLFGDITNRYSTSPQPMDYICPPPPMQTTQVSEFPGDYLIPTVFPDSPRPVAIQQYNAETDSSSTPVSSRIATDIFASTVPRTATQNVPGSSTSLLTPPSTRSNSGDDKGSSALCPAVEMHTSTNDSFLLEMPGDESFWPGESSYMTSTLWQQVNDSSHVPMDDRQLCVAPDPLFQPSPPSDTSPSPNPFSSSQTPTMSTTTSLQQPAHLETITCPDLNCGYKTKKFDPAQPSARRDAVALLRRHQSRKRERQAGPYICGGCQQVFTRPDNIQFHQRHGRCSGSEGPSRPRGLATRRANSRRGLPPLAELG